MANDCFMIRAPVGGGNILTDPLISIRRNLAIGDCVSSLVVADKLIAKGFRVDFQSHSDMHCILRRHGGLSRISPINGHCMVNLDGAYEFSPVRKTKHFNEFFIEAANTQLARMQIDLGKPLNCTPKLRVPKHTTIISRAKFEKYPRPWVFICPRSQSFFARTIPDPVWQEAAKHIEGTKFWIGLHPAPNGIVDLQVKHLDLVMDWLSVADLLITTDTGPMHLAAAMGVPILAIEQASSPELHLSDQRDFQVIYCELPCHNCQLDACNINYNLPPCQKVDPMKIATLANKRLRATFSDDVSAVIAIFKPAPEVLNRCLESILPQVDEIVVAAEGNSVIPASALQHPKIKYVRTAARRIGYSRNINRGVRETNGRWIVCCNDDVFLKPDAISKMLEVAKRDEKVGLVSNLLRYPEGTIYHSGKVRSPGVRGWGHINHRQMNPAYSEPVELENCCGCCVLMPRKVFYDIGAFDEEYFLFSQDDDMALSVRQLGYKVMFTPHSEGIHMEHQSVAKIGDVGTLVAEDNAIFHKNWAWYLDKNLYTIPGVFS